MVTQGRSLIVVLFPLCLLALSAPARAQSVSIFNSSVLFGSAAVGTTTAAMTVTVSNVGAAALNISGITASKDFTETNNCGSSLAPGKNCQVMVKFAPTVAGLIDGSVSIADNASDTPQVISLTGTGIAPVTLSPTSLTFPSTAIGSTSAVKKLTVRNNGTTTVTIDALSSSGDFNTNNCGSSLAANSTCTLR